jgi:hypothetical protein
VYNSSETKKLPNYYDFAHFADQILTADDRGFVRLRTDSSPYTLPVQVDGECLVLVTSRRDLGHLPGAVTPVLLDVLTPAQAAQMFTGLAPRAAGSPGEVAEVVRLAGFQPSRPGEPGCSPRPMQISHP